MATATVARGGRSRGNGGSGREWRQAWLRRRPPRPSPQLRCRLGAIRRHHESLVPHPPHDCAAGQESSTDAMSP
ncbi:hypothetical protein GUJ93_ZPchr0005g14644 [Zizania palustris]|uniref:Uncharacterized protein n=1 Tax=Zizania palustris TaxID=103762 RepID=A0A8J5VG73_ZIZPA|nr:hypothetical protein GUJ93_ZPchr0005g14644 [Zizania palustris]